MIQKLKEAGLKATPQRRVILEALEELELQHPSVGRIHAEALRKMPRLSVSTTYATVNELSRLGIIKLLAFEGRESRCEMNQEEHIHLACDRCGEITDYGLPFSIDREYMAHQTGFMITDSRLEYRGLCKDCRDQKQA
jgi:Fur family peroxide stress response transcriptional regulator